ncbi:hypothetical protein GDO81_029084 [Engystomops pustulosus]|uniref:Uncharacterized protein n=1 Tax=Engystomops pustulosus TaxID=76066 RepID=A0AAV6YGI8_ENGPU|nr:hypothetical protein GDO81_029084 [Engystomops pustulosus]
MRAFSTLKAKYVYTYGMKSQPGSLRSSLSDTISLFYPIIRSCLKWPLTSSGGLPKSHSPPIMLLNQHPSIQCPASKPTCVRMLGLKGVFPSGH